MQNIQKYRVICKILKTRRLWLRFIVKERLAERHLNVPYVYWRLLPPLSQASCRVSPPGGATHHHGMMVQFQKGAGRTRDYCVAKERFAPPTRSRQNGCAWE